ncbi:hypothetical protein SDC9_37475 [bioreactor metagenome]|uniref:Uncharacterized protein n=1 Tax=bioreactor metagenome TaxID=1076179 RepID=A0A644VJI4_9ZZZZ|nr:tape measure protein [Acidaminococcaceae bacterium]
MSKDIEILIKAQDQATNTLNKVKSSLNSMGSGLSGITSGLSAVTSGFGSAVQAGLGMALGQAGIQGLASALEAAGDAFVGYNARMEQAKIGFETMLGSASGAETFIAQLSKMAADTPFEFPQLQQAAQKFLAFGFSAKEIIPDLTAVGNAASGLGLGQEGIQRITLALGQMKAKGTVSGEELLQLAEAGIPAYQILAEKMNLTAKQVKNIGNEGISSDSAITALVQGMNERFPNMMQKQSETAIGVFSTIKDNASQIFGALGQPLFDAISGPLKSLRDMSNSISDSLREGGIEKVFQDMIPQDWQDRIAKIVDIFSQLFSGTGQADMWSKVFKAAFDIIGAGIDAAIPLLDLFAQGINVINTVVADVVGAVAQYISDMMAFLSEAWESIKTDASDKFGGVFDVITGAWTAIGDTMGNIWEAIKSSIWEQVSEFVTGILDRMGPLGTLVKSVGNSLSTAWGKVTNRTQSTGNNFRSWLGTIQKPASVTDEGLAALANHKGTPALEGGTDSKGSKSAEKLANKIDKLQDRIQDAYNSLNQKIVEETSTTYELGMSKINNELDKMKRELVEDAGKLGIDTSGLEGKMAEYGKVMTEPIKRAWREAWTDLKNQSALGIAQLTGNKQAEAVANEAISMASLEKERREKLKAVQMDNNDVTALAAVQAWYENQKLLVTQKRLDAERQAKIDAYNDEVEQNGLLVTLHAKTQEEVDKLNRGVLDKKIDYLNQELTKEGLTADEIKAIRKELAEATSSKEATPLTRSEGITQGFKNYTKSLSTEAQQWADAAKTAASSMNSSFKNFFFDAMTGQLDSLGKYFQSFLEGVASAISQVLANQATSALISAIFPKLKTNAVGGRRSTGESFIAGEKGPELISLDGAGASITSSQATTSQLGNNLAKVTVNVINQTGQQVTATQSTPTLDDLGNIVLDVFLNAVSTNKRGVRDVLSGVR